MSVRPAPVPFQKVVPMPAFSLSQLRSYSQRYFQHEDFMEDSEPLYTANADSTSFQYPQQFMVYNRSALKHPVGSITYRATIDLKDEKIRFTTDSVYFLPYVRNRYSRYVPENSPPMPLSEWQQQWSGKQGERFQTQIETKLEEHLQAFVVYVQEQKETQVNAKKLENW
ncbi:MAG: hypothetical protein RIG62_09030 [Cyclobacteriaceae bacterium]